MDAVGTVTWAPDMEQTPAEEPLTLLVHAMIADRHIDQACGGQAECGTCRVKVLEGLEHCSPITPSERALREAFPDRFQPDDRLACMCRPLGDLTLLVPEEELDDLRDGHG